LGQTLPTPIGMADLRSSSWNTRVPAPTPFIKPVQKPVRPETEPPT
jgi:hypothetical protein